MKKLLIYWPMGVFENVQMHKEIGAIALCASKFNMIAIIVCGKFHPHNHTFFSYESGIVKRNWLTKLLDPFFALKYILAESPDYILLYNIENYGNIFLVMLLTFLRKVGRRTKLAPIVIIKADTDGKFIETNNILYKFVYKLLIIAYSITTSGIIIETTCGIDRLNNFVQGKGKLIYLPNGYFSDIFGKVHNVTREPIITCVANIIISKNIEATLRIFKKVSEKYKDIQLKILGEIQDREYFKRLEQMIVQMNLNDKVEILTVNGEQLAKLFNKSLLTINTSLIESFGISRMESLASGTPVVTYDVGCGRDFSNFGAVVVPEGDEERMYIEVINLLSDREYWNRISYESSRTAISWDSVVQKLIYILQTNEKNKLLEKQSNKSST